MSYMRTSKGGLVRAIGNVSAIVNGCMTARQMQQRKSSSKGESSTIASTATVTAHC